MIEIICSVESVFHGFVYLITTGRCVCRVRIIHKVIIDNELFFRNCLKWVILKCSTFQEKSSIIKAIDLLLVILLLQA